MWAYARIVFRRERDATERRANVAVRSALFSKSVLCGENLLRAARRWRLRPAQVYSAEIDARPQSSQRKYTTGTESDRPITLALGAPQRGQTIPDELARLAMGKALLPMPV